MQINHFKTGKMKKEFNDLVDIDFVSQLVKEKYDPETFNCRHIAWFLSARYSNLTPIEVNTFVYNGAVQENGHIVLKVNNSPFLIDPVGDYIEYNNTVRLKHKIQPWIYVKTGTIYLSQDHMPFRFTEEEKDCDPGEDMTDLDILRLSNGPFFKGLRCITI